MCVRKISAQCVLQFTPNLAAGCVLHRPVSRVIHCSELYNFYLANRFRKVVVRSRMRSKRCADQHISSSLAPSLGTPLLPKSGPGNIDTPIIKRHRFEFLALRSQLVWKPAPARNHQIHGDPSCISVKPIMILSQVHLRKPCYDFYFL
ncbi:hypothetical protein AVEN_76241-1 [Araneus ventricosus]|uniref:Uncharacterized protein n=1 Tax=Araneus ventricosus TaxID=182803 RepID=A0A4Y2GLL8_ARAVE|nr:hypothetical protein AVEN_76241-1 [Araneus ventricosus]